MKNIKLIQNQRDLESICHDLNKEGIIFFDTEFKRRNTYFAILCLIQVANIAGEIYLIDALAPSIDLACFAEILANPEIEKVAHSAGQDIEIFYHYFKATPKNVFDTQIAAMSLGKKKGLGYVDLCAEICEVEIDKSCQKEDWSRRPLPQNMLRYAALDVKYLHQIYQTMKERLEQSNAWDRFYEQSKRLIAEETYKVDYMKAWKKVKFYNRDEGLTERMRYIAAFREEWALRVNIPRRHLATDHDLVKICQKLPTTMDEFRQCKLEKSFRTNNIRQKLLELCAGLRGD